MCIALGPAWDAALCTILGTLQIYFQNENIYPYGMGGFSQQNNTGLTDHHPLSQKQA